MGTGIHQVGPHALPRVFGGDGADQPQQAGLRGGDHGGFRPTGDGSLPSQRDDAARALLQHPRQHGAHQVERCVQVGGDDVLPLFNRHLQQRLVRSHRHIAHQHVHGAQGVNSFGHHSGNAVRVRHIADDGVGFDTQLPALGGH